MASSPQLETTHRAHAGRVPSTIDAALSTASARPIASPARSGETLFAITDEDSCTSNVPRETVTPSDEVSELTFAESLAAHAKAYLIAVLMAAGGVRSRAAEMAGVKRQHLQAMIRRHRIEIPFDPKARGRRRRECSGT